MRINVSDKQRDKRRRNCYEAIAKRNRVVDGEPLKQYYPCYNEGKHTARKNAKLKRGERRRINVALSNARKGGDTVIIADRSVASTRLFKTGYNYVV